MIVFPFAALVSLVSVLLMLGTSIHVGRARMQYQVKAPATTGHEMFERAYRIQVNTIESFLMMFPSLWIYAVFTDDLGAGVMARFGWWAAWCMASTTKKTPPSVAVALWWDFLPLPPCGWAGCMAWSIPW